MKNAIICILLTVLVSNQAIYPNTISNQLLELNNHMEIVESLEETSELDSKDELLGQAENGDVAQTNEDNSESKNEEVETAEDGDIEIEPSQPDKTEVNQIDHTVDKDIVDKNAIEDIVEETSITQSEPNNISQQDVSDFETLKNAVTKSNTQINITNHIVFQGAINVTGNNVTINGGGFTLDLNQDSATGTSNKFTVKSKNVVVKNLKIKNYLDNGISVYRASDIELRDIELIGRDKQTTVKDEQSKVAIDIYESNVKLDHITSSNHLYRSIQVRGGSTVEILSKNTHHDDTIHMQTIKAADEPSNTIMDPQNLYVKGTDKVNNDKTTVDYFLRVDVEIKTAQDLIDSIKTSGNVLHIKDTIKLESSRLPQEATKVELEVVSNILIEGYGNTIDLNHIGNFTLKGNDIQVSNLTVKNAEDIGINIYNSRDIVLNHVGVQGSKRYGIFVNGSTVVLEDCATSDNNGGIMITRSRTLRNKNHIDSVVKVVGSIKQRETNVHVGVMNLEMIDGYFQDNQFIVPANIYDRYVNDIDSKALSEYYLDLFEITGEDRNKKYDEQTIDYMMSKTVIDVTTHTEVLDDNGNPVRLIGDGIVDETENLKKLIEYAATYGKELYLPEGIYKITEDIDLSTIELPALSNFKLTGATNGLSIIDGSSIRDKMLRLMDSEYFDVMNYIDINNIVFNNVGLEFNGPQKKGITINNNVFINGRYTSERNASGNLTRVTMTPYITVKNSKYVIEQNIFLRGNDYPGRGISTYRSKNTMIKDNFFGNLEGLDDASTMLPATVIKKLRLVQTEGQFALSDTLQISGSQGNFFTAINNERYDVNTTILNNYFNMDEGREITSDFGPNVLISGINIAEHGQRRDHIIYSKGYTNLNIVGNYFKGMENGAAGGVKIRNGVNAYIGANHFKNVPLLMYIYPDLTKEECVLYDTTIYNNLFHQTTNFGGTGTGILYYQSFKEGENLNFKEDTWLDAYGDVQNFVIYNNTFMSDDRDQITISNRAEFAYENNQFLAYGNKYAEDKDVSVKYNAGNFSLSEAKESEVLAKVNSGFAQLSHISIPLTPVQVDHHHLDRQIAEANAFYNEILANGQIGILEGEYSEAVAEELKHLVSETETLINSNAITQWETNRRLTLIQETVEKLKASINDKGLAPVINGASDIQINIGDAFNPLNGVTFTDDRDPIEHLKVTIDTGNFNNMVPGTYKIRYTVVDRDGNITELIRTVVVKADNHNASGGNASGGNASGGSSSGGNASGGNASGGSSLGGNASGGNASGGGSSGGSSSGSNSSDGNLSDDNSLNNNLGNSEEDFEDSFNPNTGDPTHLWIWVLTGLLSIIGLVVINKRRNNY